MKNVREQVEKLQHKMVDIFIEKSWLDYTSNGYADAVKLVIFDNDMQIEILLWNSEDEQRKWIEKINEYEDFEVFLLRKIKECSKIFTNLHSTMKQHLPK